MFWFIKPTSAYLLYQYKQKEHTPLHNIQFSKSVMRSHNLQHLCSLLYTKIHPVDQ